MTALLLAFMLAWGGSAWLVSGKSPLRIVDTPNERSLHEAPTPHTGGVAIFFSVAIAWAWLAFQHTWPEQMFWIAISALLVALVSLADDLKGLSPSFRFAVHGIAAAILIASGLTLPWGLIGIIITWLAMVWTLNLYNFMDGMDGFAGGMTLIGFSFVGVAGFVQGDEVYALYAWSVAAASAGFLMLNFPPARLFMGDVGSATLGLLAAAFSLWGVREAVFPVWFPVLVFSPFIVDATVTLVRRLLHGEKVWQAHRSHYYQRLVQSGWGHRKTVLAEYALMLAVGASAMLMLDNIIPLIAGLIGWTILFILMGCVTDRFYATKIKKGGIQ